MTIHCKDYSFKANGGGGREKDILNISLGYLCVFKIT